MAAPLTPRQQARLVELTEHWLTRAQELGSRKLAPVELRFDLRGRSAVQYRTHPHPIIRYNAEMAAAQFQAFCQRTPPHEVAHHLVAQLHGSRRVKPHGPEWQWVMESFGLEPSRCHDYDLEQVQVRRQRRFRYRCGCREHELSATRHNRILRGQQHYLCRSCGEALEQVK
jgi:SprT protein